MPLVVDRAGVWGGRWLAGSVPGWTPWRLGEALYQSRYLSDGGRLFFNSDDALVPLDVNGTWDVYEFEPLGVGSCTKETSSGGSEYVPAENGCVGLISSGESPEESAFLDASVSGGDVFFLTTAQLVPQDTDTAYDVYDAHECTTAEPCFPAPVEQPPACVTADACRAAPTAQPEIFGAPASATFSGAGNVTPAAPKALTAAQLRAQELSKALSTCKSRYKKNPTKCTTRRHGNTEILALESGKLAYVGGWRVG